MDTQQPSLAQFYELKQELTERCSKLETANATLALLAQQSLDKAVSVEGRMNKVIGIVLSAVLLAVLKESGVI